MITLSLGIWGNTGSIRPLSTDQSSDATHAHVLGQGREKLPGRVGRIPIKDSTPWSSGLQKEGGMDSG